MRAIFRPLSFLLTFLLLVTVLPRPCQALPGPAVSLQQAIETAKGNFEVPAEYTTFTSRFSDYSSRPTWSLNWTTKENVGGNLGVEVDATTGEIVSMNIYVPDQNKTPAVRIPIATLDEAANISAKFLKKVASAHLKELRPVSPSQQSQNLNPLNNEYSLIWQRMQGNVPVRGEGATVGVDKYKGTVISYRLNWSNTSFPAYSQAITKEQAQKAFMNAGMLELQYQVPQSYRPMASGKSDDPILVYRLTHKSNGLIDALSGIPLVVPQGQYFSSLDMQGYGGFQESMKAGAVAQNETVQLTPEELDEINQTARLLSQQAATEQLYKWVPTARDMEMRSASLESEYDQPDNRIWILYLGETDSSVNSYLYARINAVTGEIISFSLDYPRNSFDPQAALSQAAAQKSAKAFLKQIQPNKIGSIRLDPNPDNLFVEHSPQPTYYFNFTRLVNGIPVQNQGINVSVDSTTGDIISFNLNWPELNFPAPTNILDLDQATLAYLNHQPLTLSFLQLYREQAPGDMRLAYLPWTEPGLYSSNLIDARSGELLGWDGKPLANTPKIMTFQDIKGIPAEREINILGQLGYFHDYGDKFMPEQPITLVSFLRALIYARDGDATVYKNDDAEVLETARERGWLTEKIDGQLSLNRAYGAKILVRYLGLEQVANLPHIYVNSFKDLQGRKDLIGAATVLKGLGVMAGKSTTFAPTSLISRSEAAQFLFRMSNVNLR